MPRHGTFVACSWAMSGHSMEGFLKAMEGRSSPRVKVRDIPARIRRKGFPFRLAKEEPARVIDIGPKGLSLVCESALEPKTRLVLTVMIPKSQILKCAGIVRNLRKSDWGYVLGIEFTRVSDRDKDFLQHNILEIAGVDVLETYRMLKDRVRGLRTSLELTVSELSDLTGVPPQRIVHIEFGMEEIPPEEILGRIATGLGVSMKDLIGEESYNEEEATAEVLTTRLAVP